MFDFDGGSLMGFMETFDARSSLIGFDVVNERGTIGLTAVIMVMRGGEPGSDNDGAPIMGDKFVD